MTKSAMIRKPLIFGIIVLLLAACEGQKQEELPTAIPQTEVPLVDGATATTVRAGATLPPTWTPLPADVQPTSAIATQAQVIAPERTDLPADAPTLPPTWTPQPSPTRRSGGSTNLGAPPAVAPPTATFTAAPAADICFTFTADNAANEPSAAIAYGESATVFWIPIPVDIYRYAVKLYHPSGQVVIDQIVDGNKFEFAPEILNAGGYVYGWEVTPVLRGQRTCYSITGEIFVEQALEG